MKCRACWSDKAYLREDNSWKACFYSYLGLLPVKCHHCFHKAWVPWFATWGQQTKPVPMASAAEGKLQPHEAGSRPQRDA